MNSLSSLLRGDNDGDSAGSLLAGLDVSRLDLATTESLITLLASTSTSASSSPLSNLQHTSQPPTSASHTSSFLTEGFSVSGSLPSILQQPVSQKLPSAPTIPGDRITEKTRFNLACARCRTKKRKCDGVRPACSNCVKAQARGGETAMCYYEESVKRKARKAGPRTDALLDKLNALESLLRPLQNVPLPQLSTANGIDQTSPALSVNASEDDDPLPEDSPTSDQMITTAQAIEAQMAFIMGGTTFSNSLVQSKSPKFSAQDTLFASLLNPNHHSNFNSNSYLNGSASSYFLGDLPESLFNNPSVSPFTSSMSEAHIDESLFRSVGGNDAMFMDLSQSSSTTSSSGFPTPPTGQLPGASPFTTFFPIPGPAISIESYADLEMHLIAIYFTYVNKAVPMLREDIFLADYVPVNRHPSALLNAMMGTSTIFSQHPLIYKRFKTPYKAAQHYLELAERQVVSVTDTASSIQTMLLIGLWDFGCFFGMQAYQWIGQSCRESNKLNLRNMREFCEYKFSVWRGPTDQPSPAQFEVRFRTWQSLIVLDTSATLVSGLPLAIAEEDHACNLVLLEKRLKTLAEESERRRRGDSSPALDNDVDLKSMSPSDDNGLSASEWKRIFANVPGDSVFDVPSPVRPHPALFRARDPVFMRWKVEPAEWVREVPTHLLTSEFDQYYLVQLCFILRRICRLRQRSDMSNDFTDSAAAISVLPNLPDVTQLHDALIQFYHSLPEGERPFKSFDDIPSSSTISGSLPHPSSNSHASWIHRASAVTLQMYFFAGLALLHDVSKSDGKRMYRMGSATGKRLNSLEVLIQAQHAQVHVIRCVYSAYGGSFRPAPSKTASDAANAIEAAMRTSQTSPPPEKNTWPLFGVSGKDTLGGKKPAQPSPSPPTPPLPLPREQLFSVENPPPPLPMVECPLAAFLIYANSVSVLSALLPGGVPGPLVAQTRMDDGPLDCLVGIRTVSIPALVEMMRVWRVAEIYLVRLRQLFEEVTSHLESRMPAFSKRFDEICVETHVPGLREYMSEFYTIKSDSARRQRPYGVTAEDERYDDPLMSASTAWEDTDRPRSLSTPYSHHKERPVDHLANILASHD